MRLHKTVIADKPPSAVFGCLCDFTTTTDWDPGTVVTVNHHGDGGAGTEVTCTAELTLKGPARLHAPLLRPAFERLGKQAQTGMHNALSQL